MTSSFPSLFSILFSALFYLSSSNCFAQSSNDYTYQKEPNPPSALETTFQQPFCYKTHNKDENSAQKYTKVIQLYKATFKDPQDPSSVWDQTYLKRNPHILEAIKDFASFCAMGGGSWSDPDHFGIQGMSPQPLGGPRASMHRRR